MESKAVPKYSGLEIQDSMLLKIMGKQDFAQFLDKREEHSEAW